MKRLALLACMGITLMAVLVPAVWRLPTRIVYNPSDSVARGWYRIAPVVGTDALHVGSIVLAWLPDDVAAFAAQRDETLVCVREQVVRIDCAAVATVRLHDGAHQPLMAWTPCRPLAEHELFLLSDTNPASFDSRYFGPIDASAVLGIATPLWTWSNP